jgi:hypothetical protein
MFRPCFVPNDGAVHEIVGSMVTRLRRSAARMHALFAGARKVGLRLPDVTEALYYGTPALKLHGEMFAGVPSHSAAEPDSLIVRMDFGRRDELIAADPETYYVKEHYEEYPCVLVRLRRVDESALRDLLLMGWRYVASRQSRPRGGRRPSTAKRR